MTQNLRRSLRSNNADNVLENKNASATFRKANRNCSRIKLTSDKISEFVNESDSEDEFVEPSNKKRNGKIEINGIPACNGSPQKNHIIVKILIEKVDDKIKYSIDNTGKNKNTSKVIPKEKDTVERNTMNSNQRSTRHLPRRNKNTNKELEEIKTLIKRNKSVIKKESTNNSESDEIDENDIDNANTSSPSKRKKLAYDGYETPTKTKSNQILSTPSSIMKNLTLNSPKSKYNQYSSVKKLCMKEDYKTSSKTNSRNNKKLRTAEHNDFEPDTESDREPDTESDGEPDIETESSFYTSQSESSDDESIYNPKNCPRKSSSKRILNKSTKKISMATPIKKFSRISLTPSVHKRVSNVAKPTTPLQQARQKLHVSVLPKSLPCREEQFNDIYVFLKTRLSDNTGGCYYISGVPGTGKTATVNEVIRVLKKASNEGNLPEFEFVDINGMKLSEPRQAYTQIWKQLTGENRTWEDAHKMLQNMFSKNNSKKMILLLVDELDMLCTKRQDVVYNLLDWPSKKNAKLIVVTIANTMDLPERVLMGKVTSRLGLTRLTFPPYNYKQLEEIVISRLKSQNAFANDSIQLVARKIAAVSGDARRALDICRRSTEVAEVNGLETVTLPDVLQALDEMIASPKIQAIKHCSTMEKYFLQAVCSEVKRTGFEEVVFQKIYDHMKCCVASDGLKPPNVTQALFICARLGSYRLLMTEHSRQDIHQRVRLNVSIDDVDFGTKNL